MEVVAPLRCSRALRMRSGTLRDPWRSSTAFPRGQLSGAGVRVRSRLVRAALLQRVQLRRDAKLFEEGDTRAGLAIGHLAGEREADPQPPPPGLSVRATSSENSIGCLVASGTCEDLSERFVVASGTCEERSERSNPGESDKGR